MATQTYDLVDQHTCRLDKALRSMEEELRSQASRAPSRALVLPLALSRRL